MKKILHCLVFRIEYISIFYTPMSTKKTYTTEEARARLIAFGKTQESLLRAKLLTKHLKTQEYANI